MKKLLSLLFILAAPAAGARSTMTVASVEYNVDTVYHATVGPGTTQTQLRLTGANPALDVFYLTVDKTTPGVSFRVVSAQDKVAGGMTVRKMAESHSSGSRLFFAGVNGDFYATSGTATNGSSVVGTPTAATICGGEIYKTSNSNYQFSVDTEGVARVCRLNFYTGTAQKGDAVTLFKGVNVSSPANGITLYTPRYWGSANQQDYAGACHQVSARLADGSSFTAGGEFDLVVTSEPATDGDMTIPEDGFVIHGRGTSTTGCNTGADAFVAALKPGDVVHFNNIILTPEGEAIHPTDVVSGNPKNVGNGKNLNSEGERGDASSRHPRTMIGVSADGNKVIMMVVDGRSTSSGGIATGMGADIMIYAGAAEAVNLDGGGSSTLYTKAFGVRNKCSDGSERAVGNAIFAVLDAPEDNEIAAISFRDWAVTVPYHGLYTPVIYGYNKYGKLVSDNVTGYTLSYSAGDVSADKASITATQKGCYALTATYGGATASIPVTVMESDGARAKYPDVILNGKKSWTAEIVAPCGSDMLPVSAEPYDWSTDNADVATVDEHGKVTPVADGKCVITGTDGAATITINATVETPATSVMALEPTHTLDPWTFSGTGIATGFTTTVLDNGFATDFKISSTRGTKFTAKTSLPTFSHPKALQIRLTPKDVSVTKVAVRVKAANESRTSDITITDPTAANEANTLRINLADKFNLSDIGIYPITVSELNFYLSGKTNTDYRLEVPGIEAVYDEADLDAIEGIIADDTPAGATPATWYNLQGIPVADPTAPGLYISSRGDKLIVK